MLNIRATYQGTGANHQHSGQFPHDLIVMLLIFKSIDYCKTVKTIPERLTWLNNRITEIARRHDRNPADISIIAVSKRQSVNAIRAAAAAGQTEFGENYVQEALNKIVTLQSVHGLTWHFIGPVQSNKTRMIATHFTWVHSLDREKTARRLGEHRPPELPPLNVCIQVNISGESSKAGVAPKAVEDLATALKAMPGLRLRGLMALPAPETDFKRQRTSFRQLRDLLKSLNLAGHELDTLSMGTSADFEAAIAEGATLIRIGTDLFGPRQQ
jgi:PLP dependent protein